MPSLASQLPQGGGAEIERLFEKSCNGLALAQAVFIYSSALCQRQL
jgi:hypothetical protein